VLCGDSTIPAQLERLMKGSSAGMMVTDPPYNVAYEGNYIQSGKILAPEKKIWRGGIENDDRIDFGEWLALVFSACDSVLQDGAAIYIWHPSGEDGKYFWAAWPYDAWHFQVDLVWNKLSLIISRWDYKPQHEPCMYGWKGRIVDGRGQTMNLPYGI
jgi:DNA modification methylase